MLAVQSRPKLGTSAPRVSSSQRRPGSVPAFPRPPRSSAACASSGNAPPSIKTPPPPLAYPTLVLPPTTWQWERADPKLSLKQLKPPQDKTADGRILNAIEFIHWASFPIGFFVAWYIFINTAKILPWVGGDPTRVFLLILGLLCQVFGGGISGNLMHTYEGWQVAPFANPLALPNPAKPGEVDQMRVPDYNNALLRATAYRMLFTFQTLGLGLFTFSVYGPSWKTVLLLGVSMAVALLGPHQPRLDWVMNNQPVLPLSTSLFGVFLFNAGANVFAWGALFSKVFLPFILPHIPLWVGGWSHIVASVAASLVAALAPLCVAAGGALEGAVAESTFNQWWHLVSFVILTVGLGLHWVWYRLLINTPVPPPVV